MTATLALSESAARRVEELRRKKGQPGLMLRVAVNSGGCSGFQYQIGFADTLQTDDRTFTQYGVTVVTDDVSLEYLGGCEIDYVESLIGASFQVRNPNAASSCGCGASFSV